MNEREPNRKTLLEANNIVKVFGSGGIKGLASYCTRKGIEKLSSIVGKVKDSA